MMKALSSLSHVINCDCGSFKSSPDRVFQCSNCGTIIPFFRDLHEFKKLPPSETAIGKNPTSVDLVWGTHQIDRYFKKRVNIVKNLISTLPVSNHDNVVGADVSGGAGRWLSHLALLFDIFLHMDISKEALKAACSTRKKNGNIIYVQNDLLASQQMVKNVDVAICLDTLLYGDDFIDRALEGCSKVLNDKGILILELSSKYHNTLGRVLKFKKRDAVERNFTICEARNILRDHGFNVIKEIYLFKEIPFNFHSILNTLKLPDSLINMCTWFYFVVSRNAL